MYPDLSPLGCSEIPLLAYLSKTEFNQPIYILNASGCKRVLADRDTSKRDMDRLTVTFGARQLCSNADIDAQLTLELEAFNR